MSRYSIAIILAVYTCLGWGMISPAAVKMIKHMGAERFDPALPFLWTTMGHIFFSVLLLLATGFAPLKVWVWHWSGWVIFLAWPSASLAIAYALYFADARPSGPNALAATYPAFVSAIVLWYFLGEAMSLQKVIGLVVTVVGVILVILG